MKLRQRSSQRSRDELAGALDQIARLSVTPSAILMFVTYSALSVCHIFMLPSPASVVMPVLSGSSAILSACLWRFHNRVKWLRPHDILGLFMLLILCNIATHMALVQDHLQSTYFALVMVGSGFLMLDRFWFATTLLAYLATWTTIFVFVPSASADSHFAYLIGISAVISVAVHIARHRTTVRSERTRILGERRRHQMEIKVRRQQDQLAHASRLITMGELVAGIAHELNQPLSSISNYASACELELHRENLSAVGRQLELIRETAVRAGSIIRRLRGLVSGSERVRQEVNLNDVVRDSVGLLASDFRQNNIDLILELDDDIGTVQADPIQMQQVIINFLQNGLDSLKVSPHPKHVTIRSALSENGPCVSVLDNGAGIRTPSPNSVFDVFFTTKANGMGMGLAICRSIVENHGGKIWCDEHESQSDHTAFHFSIPASANEVVKR